MSGNALRNADQITQITDNTLSDGMEIRPGQRMQMSSAINDAYWLMILGAAD